VHHDDTWHIHRPGDVVPPEATWSDCSVKPSISEYADETGSAVKAWVSHSVISFDYRVVEVPQGRLLDPACDALIFGHLAHGSPEREEQMAQAQRRLVVIDEKVHELYGNRVKAYFRARDVEHEILVLPMNEDNKSMEMALKVAKKMKQFNIDRRTEPVLAIGGGVCLDVVGCAASLFRRRTPYIRVPTTALSYVDASVGAKNGVNFAGSKNRLGTYVPPCAALLDPGFFATQEYREVSNSLGEMAKMAIMKSPELYELLEKNGQRLAAQKFARCSVDDDVPGKVLQLSIETMLEELAPNLWEHSLDRLVDFGHATGQDLEMEALGTEHELKHGEAVAVDMALMTVLAQQIGLLTVEERDRTLNLLRQCQVPVWSPVMTYKLWMEAVANRVKNSMGQRFPLPAGIGKGRIVNGVPEADLKRAFDLWQELCGKDECFAGA
jgi:3-dehydroquinate synthase